ncbi:MAG: hypothetical protein ACOC8C_00870 [Chloroflexota bacterium]
MKKAYSVALAVLSVLTMSSLLLNGVVIYALLEAREMTHRLVGDARMLVSELSDETFQYSFEFEQEFPIRSEFPFSGTFTVPMNTVIPIDTTVVVPVDLGITTYRLRVPINTVFPVDMEFTVPVSQVVDVDLVVPVSLDVPVEIPVRDTTFVAYLREVDGMLKRTEEQLQGPIWGR